MELLLVLAIPFAGGIAARALRGTAIPRRS